MESNRRFELVGGIAAVVLYPTTTPLPDEPTTNISDIECDCFAVSLEVGEASYVESMSCGGGASTSSGGINYTVKHTLTFHTSHDESPLSDYYLAKALNEGLIADVTLATGATIRLGWSERYGVSYPLRLVSTTFDSGSKALDYPLKSWVFEYVDQSTLI